MHYRRMSCVSLYERTMYVFYNDEKPLVIGRLFLFDPTHLVTCKG